MFSGLKDGFKRANSAQSRRRKAERRREVATQKELYSPEPEDAHSGDRYARRKRKNPAKYHSPRWVYPKRWPRDDLEAPCEHCVDSETNRRKRHARNVCCGAARPDLEHHTGELEPVEWRYWYEDSMVTGMKMGWYGCIVEEEEEMKQFAEDSNYDALKMFKKWPDAFRWTCCGASWTDGTSGCDHHSLREPHCRCCYCFGGIIPPPGALFGASDEEKRSKFPSYTSNQHNRFLKLNGDGGGVWHQHLCKWSYVVGVEWTPELHHRYPKAFQRQVRTLMLCRARVHRMVLYGSPDLAEHRGFRLMAAFPTEVLVKVVEYWAMFETLLGTAYNSANTPPSFHSRQKKIEPYPVVKREMERRRRMAEEERKNSAGAKEKDFGEAKKKDSAGTKKKNSVEKKKGIAEANKKDSAGVRPRKKKGSIKSKKSKVYFCTSPACKAEDPRKMCALCPARYCGKECSNPDWKRHRKECAGYAERKRNEIRTPGL